MVRSRQHLENAATARPSRQQRRPVSHMAGQAKQEPSRGSHGATARPTTWRLLRSKPLAGPQMRSSTPMTPHTGSRSAATPPCSLRALLMPLAFPSSSAARACSASLPSSIYTQGLGDCLRSARSSVTGCATMRSSPYPSSAKYRRCRPGRRCLATSISSSQISGRSSQPLTGSTSRQTSTAS